MLKETLAKDTRRTNPTDFLVEILRASYVSEVRLATFSNLISKKIFSIGNLFP